MTMRIVPSLCALFLGAGAAFATGCGDRSGLLPKGTAGQVRSELGAVREQVDAGDCPGADSAIDRARSAVKNADGLDPGLRSRLLNGIGKLSGRAQQECLQQKPKPETPADTTTTDTTDTAPTTPETETTDSTPTEPPPSDTGTPSTPAPPTDPGPDGGVSPDDPSIDPNAPGAGGTDPSAPGTGNDGFSTQDRDRSGVEGYYP